MLREARVYALAEYFCVEGLKDYVYERLDRLLGKLWVSEGFVDCIREVYSTTPNPHDRLRALVSKVAHKHISELWGKEKFREIVQDGGDFAVDLIAQSIGKLHEAW